MQDTKQHSLTDSNEESTQADSAVRKGDER
jgi:hypothetical protein